ncbi:MAG: DUF308 domain-containing protein [Alphaproteobacteria bacterium]|nr:DUF308 domain-containing protein [Alphaproteobacteria bacterium]
MTETKKDLKVRKGLLLSSVFMIIAGILAWIFPDSALLAAALYLGVMFIISGCGYLMDFYSLRSGWLLAMGLLDFILGGVLILNLGIAAESLPFLLAIWILCIAVLQVSVGLDSKATGNPTWKWLLISGLLGILFGLWILGSPLLGIFTVSTLLGFYLVLYGGLGVAEYLEIKKKTSAASNS